MITLNYKWSLIGSISIRSISVSVLISCIWFKLLVTRGDPAVIVSDNRILAEVCEFDTISETYLIHKFSSAYILKLAYTHE